MKPCEDGICEYFLSLWRIEQSDTSYYLRGLKNKTFPITLEDRTILGRMKQSIISNVWEDGRIESFLVFGRMEHSDICQCLGELIIWKFSFTGANGQFTLFGRRVQLDIVLT